MKKITQFLGFLIFGLSALINVSCNDTLKSDKDTYVDEIEVIPDDGKDRIDLRNKDSSGNSFRAVDNSPYTFSSTLENFTCDKNHQPDETMNTWFKNSITAEDDENGVKFIFHKPEGEKFAAYPITWLDIRYIDGNGKESTKCSIEDYSIMNNYSTNGGARDTFYTVFPLVLPGKEVKFKVQYAFGSPSNGQDEYGGILYFKINTAHGKAMVDNLPEDFNPLSFIEFTDGYLLTVHDVIPPNGKDKKQQFNFWGGTSPNAWDTSNGNDFHQISFKSLSPLGSTTNSYTFDLRKIFKPTDNLKLENSPYVWIGFDYQYKLEQYPGLLFCTTAFNSLAIENTVFTENYLKKK